MDEPRRRAVVLTALQVEYDAVKSHLKGLDDDRHLQGAVYERGFFEAEGLTWEVCIHEIGAGNANAALATERIIAHFKPQVAFFVGVAGGIKDVGLGDVVVATKLYGYESGKADKVFKPRPDVGQSTFRMIERARFEGRRDDWMERLDAVPKSKPRVFVAPMAAGEKVISSTKSAVYRFLRSSYGDALAVEMEGRGFLEATRTNKEVEALVVRGISDLLEGKAEADKSGSQEVASGHAAAFAFQVLAKLYVKREVETRLNAGHVRVGCGQEEEAMKPSSPRRVQKNTIINGANVIADTTVQGDVHIGPTTINQINRGRRSSRPTEYPAGSIGSDLPQRNYVRHLIQRYHHFRDADSSFGRSPARFSYAVTFKNIERKFKVSTYLIPQTRFNELVEYLQRHVNGTILGRRNGARGIPNYKSLDEFAAEQAGQ
jgi:nucleoside phosphorylase